MCNFSKHLYKKHNKITKKRNTEKRKSFQFSTVHLSFSFYFHSVFILFFTSVFKSRFKQNQRSTESRPRGAHQTSSVVPAQQRNWSISEQWTHFVQRVNSIEAFLEPDQRSWTEQSSRTPQHRETLSRQ